jgi:phenylacetic acid degradation operon negative regulatory protein
MTSDASPTFHAAAAALTTGEGHRVWSLIVTIFGDLAQEQGDTISGPVLSRLTGLMGVKPQAMRVALHRLRKDGWIESAREGRASTHFLTAYGRAQSAAATPRIYGTGASDPGRWHVLISGGGDGRGAARLEAFLQSGDYLALGSQAILAPGPLPADHQGLIGAETGAMVPPEWLRAQICPQDVLAACERLHAAFEAVAQVLQTGGALPADECAALRALVVHSWRRVILRHPDLPQRFFPQGWLGAECRVQFASLMAALPTPGLGTLEMALAGDDSTRSAATR